MAPPDSAALPAAAAVLTAPFLLAGADGLLDAVAHVAGGVTDLFQHFTADGGGQAVVGAVHVLRHFRHGALHPEAAAHHVARALGVQGVELPLALSAAPLLPGSSSEDRPSDRKKSRR